MIKIGYQGIEGSNSEAVALEFAKDLKEDYTLVPLVNSKNVVNAIETDETDYGVMATFNVLGGTVIETEEALKGKNFSLVREYRIPIHHCLFVKEHCTINDIDTIASHEQALKQTKNNRKKFFKNMGEMDVEDTALAAKYLADGTFGDNIAILCRKNAGESFNLKLLYENLEDDPTNYTEFGVYKKAIN